MSIPATCQGRSPRWSYERGSSPPWQLPTVLPSHHPRAAGKRPSRGWWRPAAAAPSTVPGHQRKGHILSIRESYRGQHFRPLWSELAPPALPANGWGGPLPWRAAVWQGLLPVVFLDCTCVRDRRHLLAVTAVRESWGRGLSPCTQPAVDGREGNRAAAGLGVGCPSSSCKCYSSQQGRVSL